MSEKKENWFQKHSDLLITLGFIFGGFYWMDTKFEKINEKMDQKFTIVDQRFQRMDERMCEIENTVTSIKTVLIIKNIMPHEIAKEEGKK